MAIVTPQSDLVLLKCPLEVDQQNQLDFNNATAQYNYFNSLPKFAVNDFTYQRKDGTVRFPAQIDDIRTYNYCMYRNDAYSNKWFYAFVSDAKYVNDNVTEIKLKTDVWQTWGFDIVWKPSFVEREHTNNDAVGENILDEGLNVGEYTVNDSSSAFYMNNNQNYYIAAMVTETILMNKVPSTRVYGGIPQGCWILLLEASDPGNVNNFVRAYDARGKADAIVSMYILPKSLVPNVGVVISYDDKEYGYGFDATTLPTSTTGVTLSSHYWTRNTSINGYVPKNNKLFCYPYNYLMISNNNGDDNVYHWEDFSSTHANFTMKGVPTQGCQIRLIPSNYKNVDVNDGYQWASTAMELPTVSWNSDFYLNWQAKNGLQSGFKATDKYASDYMAAGQAVSQDASIISPENVISGAAQTLSTFGQMFGSIMSEVKGGYSASITPDQTRGTSTGDLTYSLGRNCFTAYKMSIKASQARMIDDYFSMFGYRTDRLKVPNTFGRRYWNFVKTRVANIEGEVPQDDINELKAIFNSGITIWHDPSKYLDYSQNNAIV